MSTEELRLSAWSTGPVHHVGMRVAQLDRAIEWYGQALDFRLQSSYPLGANGRLAFLRNSVGARLELFELEPFDPTPAWEHPSDALARGHAHVALCVSDVGQAVGRAVQIGARLLMGPVFATPLGAEAAYIADPDNNLLELVGFTER